jgi:hypothetical protein
MDCLFVHTESPESFVRYVGLHPVSHRAVTLSELPFDARGEPEERKYRRPASDGKVGGDAEVFSLIDGMDVRLTLDHLKRSASGAA